MTLTTKFRKEEMKDPLHTFAFQGPGFNTLALVLPSMTNIHPLAQQTEEFPKGRMIDTLKNISTRSE